MDRDIPLNRSSGDKHTGRAVPPLDTTGAGRRHEPASPTHAHSTASLTHTEVEFAVKAGVPAEVFDGGTPAPSEEYVARTPDETALDGPSYTTGQVAEMLGLHPSTVRRMLASGYLYAARPTGQKFSYPAWQFASSGILPHLREVLALLPSTYRARDVQAVMTTRIEEIDGRSPREWLETGGDPTPVFEILYELSLS